jgi:hypothetical protein
LVFLCNVLFCKCCPPQRSSSIDPAGRASRCICMCVVLKCIRVRPAWCSLVWRFTVLSSTYFVCPDDYTRLFLDLLPSLPLPLSAPTTTAHGFYYYCPPIPCHHTIHYLLCQSTTAGATTATSTMPAARILLANCTKRVSGSSGDTEGAIVCASACGVLQVLLSVSVVKLSVQFNNGLITWVIQEEPVSALLPVGFFKCDVPELPSSSIICECLSSYWCSAV